MLTFQRLDVYRCAIEFLAIAHPPAETFPLGQSQLGDQLRRAAMSVPLNIAEASGRSGDADKKRHFGIARGSAMECAAIFDVAKLIGIVDDPAYQEGAALLTRVV